ncbi:MAG TPA: CBS domain-containing protein [Chryseolinea sp.]
MEAMLVVFLGLIAGWVCLAFFAAGFAGVNGNWREEVGFNERFIRRVKGVREVHRKEPTPMQTTKTTVTVASSPENAAVSSHHPCETTLVRSVMVKTPYYCRENQPDEEALKMMRELDLPHLPVLDSNLSVVGVVSMKDIMRSREQKDPHHQGNRNS